MIYRTLGQSGLKVSALTLGTMMFGEQTSTEDSLRIIDKAWDQGINFIDTADVYTGGRSEEIVGEAIASGEVEVILKDWKQAEGAVHLVTPPGGPRPARVEVLADFLAAKLPGTCKRRPKKSAK